MTKNGIEVWYVFLLVIVFKISEPGHKKSQMGLVFRFGKIAGPFMLLSHYIYKIGGAGLYGDAEVWRERGTYILILIVVGNK